MSGHWLTILLILTAQTVSHGQEMLGVVTGDYAGSGGKFINPSSIANTRLKMDFNLVTFHAFAENNYFYLPAGEATFIKILNRTYRFPFHPKPYGEGERNVFAYYEDLAKKTIQINGRLVGPSAMFTIKDHVIAVHAAARAVSSIRGLPYDMANFFFYGLDFYPQHNITYTRSNYRMASLGWMEVGFTYATVIRRNLSHLWSAGATVNLLFGNSGAFVDGGKTTYVAYNDSILNVEQLNASLGLSLPVDYTSDELAPLGGLIRGGGVGIDLGVTYQHRHRPYRKKPPGHFYDKRFEEYDYKIGLSLLDIGSVKFRDNAELHEYKDVSNNYINVNDLEYNNIRDELDELSRLFYGDPTASLAAGSFNIFLPMALSLQVDYHFAGPWYLNGTAVVPLDVASVMIKRPSMIAAVPRYETRAYAIQVPLVLYNYNQLRLGMAIRIWDLTLGSDKLGAFFGYKDFTGMDIYASYKVNILYKDRTTKNRKDPCRTF